MADGNEEIIGQETETMGTETDVVETTDTETFDFLNTVKLLLGISDDSEDVVLQVYIDFIKQSILNYCNITELPSALNYTLCSMTCDVYRENKNNNQTGSVVGNVSSISEDGRTVAFTNGSEIKTSIDNTISKTTELNRYRKLYRI